MDPKALAPSGSSDIGPVSSSNAHYFTAVPANARVQLIARLKPHIFHIRTKPRDDSYFNVNVRPNGTFTRFPSSSRNWSTFPLTQLDQSVIARKSMSASRARQQSFQSIQATRATTNLSASRS
ncbi:MAG: hypothetical protein JOS17DRAFT_792938 [Linnemannia elongata]|nr:MAG: hypothetical protein JOS17DRAFT_792938 [Linnemannia elongata]